MPKKSASTLKIHHPEVVLKAIILSSTSGTNLELANNIKTIADSLDINSEILNLETYSLPLYTPTEEKNGIPPEALKLTEKLIQADLIVALAPEYNGSIPPIFSNAISWASRSGQDWRQAFNGKMGIIGTHSGGGGQKVLMSLRIQLEHLGVMVHPRPIVVNSTKQFTPDSCETILNQIKKLLA